MDVSPSAFRNQQMYFANPSIQTFDTQEFTSPVDAEYAPISQQVAAQAYELPSERTSNIGGFMYDPAVSDERHAIYVHHGKTKSEKKVLTGFRGTDSSNSRDLYTDVQLTRSNFHRTRHSKEAHATFDKVVEKYPSHTHHLTGHSLGAHTSYSVHHNNHKKVKSSIGFNTPGSTLGVISSAAQHVYQTPAQKAMSKNRVEYINRFDPVSIFARHRTNRKRNKSFSLNPHSLDQWKRKPHYFGK